MILNNNRTFVAMTAVFVNVGVHESCSLHCRNHSLSLSLVGQRSQPPQCCGKCLHF